MKKNFPSILQELESDDELPDIYNDVTILPDYLDDNRFDEIKFPWVNNAYLKKAQSQCESNNALLRHEGVLKGQDLFCLKSVESFTCSRTFIWFINFLLLKDMQSHYNYLKSCLVNDLIFTTPYTKKNCNQDSILVKDRLEIVVKA